MITIHVAKPRPAMEPVSPSTIRCMFWAFVIELGAALILWGIWRLIW